MKTKKKTSHYPAKEPIFITSSSNYHGKESDSSIWNDRYNGSNGITQESCNLGTIRNAQTNQGEYTKLCCQPFILFRNNSFFFRQQLIKAFHKIRENTKKRIIEVLIEFFQLLIDETGRFQRFVEFFHLSRSSLFVKHPAVSLQLVNVCGTQSHKPTDVLLFNMISLRQRIIRFVLSLIYFNQSFIEKFQFFIHSQQILPRTGQFLHLTNYIPDRTCQNSVSKLVTTRNICNTC